MSHSSIMRGSTLFVLPESIGEGITERNLPFFWRKSFAKKSVRPVTARCLSSAKNPPPELTAIHKVLLQTAKRIRQHTMLVRTSVESPVKHRRSHAHEACQKSPAIFLSCACFHEAIALNSERDTWKILAKSPSRRCCSFFARSTPGGASACTSSARAYTTWSVCRS